MANFFQDAKNKIQDLFIYIVSCGKSSNEPARDVPLGDELGQQIYIPEEGQAGLATNIAPIRFSKEPPRNDQEPTRDHVLEDDLGIIKVFPSGDAPPINNAQNQEEENIIAQQGQELDKSKGNSQEQKEIDDDEDFEPLPKGFIIPEERANFSTPPGKRSAPRPKTG
ncbi:hypothetical protein KY290_020711 [Solanum tuberosum]|uniref:Uncharacterized protein n=1 Tax=Solanum tuberosum TaxID=4113 RepID=A0ABQ7UZF7_SOLTU|nr:hypothetical protein KY290_020711 [Solanum tuberosum]